MDSKCSSCAALRAQVEEFKGANLRVNEMLVQANKDAKNAESRATRAEAELAECKHELSSLRNTLDDLVAIQRERAEKAEAERDEAKSRVERVRKAYLAEREKMAGDDDAAWIAADEELKAALEALAECGEVE